MNRHVLLKSFVHNFRDDAVLLLALFFFLEPNDRDDIFVRFASIISVFVVLKGFLLRLLLLLFFFFLHRALQRVLVRITHAVRKQPPHLFIVVVVVIFFFSSFIVIVYVVFSLLLLLVASFALTDTAFTKVGQKKLRRLSLLVRLEKRADDARFQSFLFFLRDLFLLFLLFLLFHAPRELFRQT